MNLTQILADIKTRRAEVEKELRGLDAAINALQGLTVGHNGRSARRGRRLSACSAQANLRRAESAVGAIEQESDYYPFGTEVVVTAGPNNYKFTGKERDSESGLDYFGKRYYGSALGRWTSPDPKGPVLSLTLPDGIETLRPAVQQLLADHE